MEGQLNPSHIMQVGSGFWASKVLLTAVDFELFTVLGNDAKTGKELEKELKLHPRGTWDFLDAPVALKFLDRDGDDENGKYRNTPETSVFLDKNSPQYIGGILEMFDQRLFHYWNDLGEGLRTGKPQNEIKETGKPIFEELYKNPEGLKSFMNAMSGISMGNFMAFAKKFDFQDSH